MAFEIKTSKWLNESQEGNFVFAPIGNVCNVQIFEELAVDTCAEMVGHLSQIISQLPIRKPIFSASAKIVSPYDITPDTFILNVAIDSPGGDILAYRAIASMFALAKSRGAIVRTHNIGMAASASSLLAVQGTPGYRIMSEDASNFVHYGSAFVSGSRENELEIATKNSKRIRDMLFEVYKKYTKLSQKELEKYKTVENSGQLFAKTCLAKQLCDWILTTDGHLIGRGR